MLTTRGEVSKRLRAFRAVYNKRPDSYNATLGIGRPTKDNDRPFSGFGIDGKRYINGVSVDV